MTKGSYLTFVHKRKKTVITNISSIFGKASLKISLRFWPSLFFKEVKIICCLNVCFYFEKDTTHNFAWLPLTSTVTLTQGSLELGFLYLNSTIYFKLCKWSWATDITANSDICDKLGIRSSLPHPECAVILHRSQCNRPILWWVFYRCLSSTWLSLIKQDWRTGL